MGKTVLMRKGDKFADIFDSAETIAQAQKDGYHICTEAEASIRKIELEEQVQKDKSPVKEKGKKGEKRQVAVRKRERTLPPTGEAGSGIENASETIEDSDEGEIGVTSDAPAEA